MAVKFLVRGIQAALALLLAALAAALAGLWAAAAFFAALLALVPAGYYLYCLLRLRTLAARDPGAAADFVFGAGAWLAGALQHREEILPFLKSFPEPPRAVGEIGRAQGGTLALLCAASAQDALVISLDLPGAAFSGELSALNRAFWRRPLLRAMKGPGRELVLLDGDSRSSESLRRFGEALGGRRLDLLFIDGDHSYEGVKADYERYSGFVRPGGVIAFHDIQPCAARPGVEVSRFWRDYPLPGTRTEYVKDRAQDGMGIGAVRLPG
ncbi:MAG: class I SAM-dependent methyltransferase [Elusimicrobiales bacterium]|nr:class I SAM-dependent methyltransferase [Elusimicrobiales bacterium]